MKFGQICTALAATILAAGMTQGAHAKELRMATAAPEKTPWGTWFNGVVKKVSENFAGKVTIVPYYSSQLGNEQDVIRQSVRGRIDISGQSNTATSLIVPEFALLAAPYLWDSPEHADCVFDNHVGQIFSPMLERKGLKLLTYLEVGNMISFSRKPIKTPGDMKSWKKLSAEEQKWIFEGAQQAGKLRTGIRGAEKALLGKIAKGGVPVYYPNAQEMYEWRAKGKAAHETRVKELGGQAPAIWRQIQSAIATCRA